MSAFLSSNDCLNALATYWGCKHRERGDDRRNALTRAVYNSSEPTADSWRSSSELVDAWLATETPERVVWKLLLMENVLSLNARYPNDPEMSDFTGYAFKPSRRVIEHNVFRGSAFVVGLVTGYEYQSCEHDGWGKSVAYQICQQIRYHLLKDFAKSGGESAETWASWTELDLLTA